MHVHMILNRGKRDNARVQGNCPSLQVHFDNRSSSKISSPTHLISSNIHLTISIDNVLHLLTKDALYYCILIVSISCMSSLATS